MSALIMAYNFIDSDELANYQVSSEDPGYPVVNAFNANRRSKMWRSGGYWKIASGSNTIKFNVGGADQIATVAAAEYSSTTSFFAAVAAAFNALSLGTYTVVADPLTLKCRVTKTVGGGVLNIKWTDASSLAMAAVLGFTADDTGALTYAADVLKISYPNEWILFDMGIETIPNYFIMTGERNRPLPLSPGGTFKLQGNETNPADWSSPTYSKTLTYDDESIVELSAGTGLYSAGLRYWRLEFNDQNPLGYVSIGAFFLGNALWDTLSVYGSDRKFQPQFPYNAKMIDPSATVISIGQNTFSDALPQTKEHTLVMKFGSKQAQEEFEDFYRKVGQARPFFIIPDPNANVATSVNRVTHYAKFSSDPQPSLQRPNLYEMSIQYREEL